jgi:hypothetical protein
MVFQCHAKSAYTEQHSTNYGRTFRITLNKRNKLSNMFCPACSLSTFPELACEMGKALACKASIEALDFEMAAYCLSNVQSASSSE